MRIVILTNEQHAALVQVAPTLNAVGSTIASALACARDTGQTAPALKDALAALVEKEYASRPPLRSRDQEDHYAWPKTLASKMLALTEAEPSNVRLREIEARARRAEQIAEEHRASGFYEGIGAAADYILNAADDDHEFGDGDEGANEQ